jgi:ABC-type antimicrobial peptide transport system permease subunit
MVLACVGIAGTIGYAVTRRTSEIGIRMALGARPSHVVRTVLRGVLTAVTAGVAAGATLTLASARLVDHMLFGVSASDPKVLLWSAGIFALSAVIAASIPARHAARVDPVVALRHESEDV